MSLVPQVRIGTMKNRYTRVYTIYRRDVVLKKGHCTSIIIVDEVSQQNSKFTLLRTYILDRGLHVIHELITSVSPII